MINKVKSILTIVSTIAFIFSVLVLCKTTINITLKEKKNDFQVAKTTKHPDRTSGNQGPRSKFRAKNSQKNLPETRKVAAEKFHLNTNKYGGSIIEEFDKSETELIEELRSAGIPEDEIYLSLGITKLDHISKSFEKNIAVQDNESDLSEYELRIQLKKQFLNQGLAEEEIEKVMKIIFRNVEMGMEEIELSRNVTGGALSQEDQIEETIDYFFQSGISMDEIEERIEIMFPDLDSVDSQADLEENEIDLGFISQSTKEEIFDQILETGISMEDAEKQLNFILPDSEVESIGKY